jgi:hypothetical protein
MSTLNPTPMAVPEVAAPTTPATAPAPESDALLQAILEDWVWLIEERQKIGPLNAYDGEFVAIVDRTLLGHGQDPEQLRMEVARKYQLNPDRVVVALVGE